MSKKISVVVALVGLCALSSLLLNCGTSSSRPTGVLYVLTQGSNGYGNSVSSFSIDLNSGSLSLVNSNASTCPTQASAQNPEPCGAPLDILLDPMGATAFVLNQGIPCITQQNQCVPTGSSPIAPSIIPYTVSSDGSLSAPGTGINWTCVSPNGTACTYYDDTATAMVRDAAGAFLFVIDEGVYPPPATCPLIAAAVASANDATNFTGCPSISVFSMTPGKAILNPVSQSSTYQSPLYLSKIPSALSTITFTPNGSSTAEDVLFVTDNYDLCSVSCLPPGGVPGPSTPNDNALSVYTVSSTGQLSEQSYSPYAIAASDPISVIAVNTFPAGVNAGGLFVYVGNQGSTVGAVNPFQLCTVVNANCDQSDVAENLLIPVTCPPAQSCSVSAGQKPVAMVVDPTNNFLYVLSEGSNQVFGFRINGTQGTLTPLAPANEPSQGSQPVSMALHPTVNNTGQFLFVSNSGSQSIASFALSTTTGSMSTSPTTTITPPTPTGIAVH